MHFHSHAYCLSCRAYYDFNTDIPDTLILADKCVWCELFDQVGAQADDSLCRACVDHWLESVLKAIRADRESWSRTGHRLGIEAAG